MRYANVIGMAIASTCRLVTRNGLEPMIGPFSSTFGSYLDR